MCLNFIWINKKEMILYLLFAKVENKNKQCYNVMQRFKSNNNVTIRGIRILWGIIFYIE